jgi:hypothetical protein
MTQIYTTEMTPTTTCTPGLFFALQGGPFDPFVSGSDADHVTCGRIWTG